MPSRHYPARSARLRPRPRPDGHCLTVTVAVETVEPAHGLEEHQRARASDDVDAVLAAQFDGLVGDGSGSADPLEQPDPGNAEFGALPHDSDGCLRVHHHDDEVELAGHARQVGDRGITADGGGVRVDGERLEYRHIGQDYQQLAHARTINRHMGSRVRRADSTDSGGPGPAHRGPSLTP